MTDTNLTFICSNTELSDPASLGFSVEKNGEEIECFLVKKDGQYFAFRNSCPHTGSPLDWLEHQFLDLDGLHIQCAVHDARFVIETGKCVAGPCYGDSLKKLEIEVRNDGVYLQG
ncbi:MAG: nitrite reductase/ring-hydroxylating ferredoxin subunit [Gammaproteobacteria bacterium]|jgi:nitrite reductase/ring-hydroxylating ferredoxin subunit